MRYPAGCIDERQAIAGTKIKMTRRMAIENVWRAFVEHAPNTTVWRGSCHFLKVGTSKEVKVSEILFLFFFFETTTYSLRTTKTTVLMTPGLFSTQSNNGKILISNYSNMTTIPRILALVLCLAVLATGHSPGFLRTRKTEDRGSIFATEDADIDEEREWNRQRLLEHRQDRRLAFQERLEEAKEQLLIDPSDARLTRKVAAYERKLEELSEELSDRQLEHIMAREEFLEQEKRDQSLRGKVEG